MKTWKIIAVVTAAGLAALATMKTGNSAATSENSADKSLLSRRYRINLKEFVGETEKLILKLSTYGQKWRVAAKESSETAAFLKIEVPVLIFTDDLEIRAEIVADSSEIIVNVSSKSRVGANDLGENRRHIRQLLKRLDEKFAANR